MQAIDLETGAGLKLFIKRLEQLVTDLVCTTASAADQVMVIVQRNFIDKLPAADMRRQEQPLVGQEVQRAVNSRFRQAGQSALGALANFQWRQVSVGITQDAQDGHPLWGHPEA